MRRYESYKDSGVEWLGEVPSHWEISSLGKILLSVSEKNRPDLPLLSITRELGVIERDTEDQDSNHNFIPDDLSNYKILKKGQFGMNKMKAWQGSYGVSDFTGIVSPAYYIFDFIKSINPQFFHWAIRSKIYVSFLGSASDGVRIGQWDLSKSRMKSIPFIIPSNDEQQKIAQFLDDKTAKIDQAVDLAEKQIALLKEHKQILIQNAVTRGLNPDVPLKDSGVEWIGKVPEHWEVKKLKYLAKLSPSKSEITCNHEESCSFIPMEKLKLNTLVLDEIKQIKNVYSAYTYFRDEDLLIAKVTPCFENKNFAIAKNLVNSIGFGSSEIYVLRTYNNLLNKFLFYRLQEQNFMEIAISKMSGTGGLKRVPSEFINNFQLALPPFCEQQKIADYLDKQTAKIDQAIALKTAHIEKLKEYKSVLINDVVTGKVRV